jgi:5-methylcytosine-specific restriction endonuclease McrA
VILSAKRLHELALEAFRIGNRGRLSLCEALRVLNETRLYFDLGFPSLAAYADTFFHLRRAESFEHVRVAKALLELIQLRDAFARGRIGWSALKAITRVASVASQAAWIELARHNGVERVLAEAQDALRRGRDAPRQSSFGLPNLDQKLVLRFSRSDMDQVRKWIERACAVVVEKTGMPEVSVEQAILFLCENGSGPDTTDGGDRSGRARIVYQSCPDCRRARVGTRDGFVEVAPGEVERHEGCAELVAIDGPTPPSLRRRILGREGGRCGNPRCRRPARHCHHLVFRSRGGRTELANEVAVCTTCHALIHAGLLRVRGNACGELRWLPAVHRDSPEQAVRSDRAVADRLPVLRLEARPEGPGSTSRGSGESAIADSVSGRTPGCRPGATDSALNLDDLTCGLMRLGVPRGRSKQMIDAAVEALPRGELTEANVLRRAIASI